MHTNAKPNLILMTKTTKTLIYAGDKLVVKGDPSSDVYTLDSWDAVCPGEHAVLYIRKNGKRGRISMEARDFGLIVQNR